ncbi:MAG: tryptophan synthase subunit alpha, partial [Flavobacteriaceae bacterium]|nr:tryptophan synthase subunit alpha [Flavobacteriaceae bacterium]
MNRILEKLRSNKTLLSIYFTAGFPTLESTVPILEALQKSGVDMVEIGLPFSDPLADGPTIQASSTRALQNGMTSDTLFGQLATVRNTIDIPLLIMGYFNPILQYGVEKFCARCEEIGIDGIIIPDLPLAEYESEYRPIFEAHGLLNIFLISPQTSEERIRAIDQASEGFIYMVSSSSTTGSSDGFGNEQQKYFQRVADMQLKNPRIVGFGIKDAASFQAAT